jgi:hypothetical protein
MCMIFKIANIRLCKAMNTPLKIMVITSFEVICREMQNLINTSNKLQSRKIPLKYFCKCFCRFPLKIKIA